MNWRIRHPKFSLYTFTEYSEWLLDWKVLGHCWIPTRIVDCQELRDAYILRYYEEPGFWVSRTGDAL